MLIYEETLPNLIIPNLSINKLLSSYLIPEAEEKPVWGNVLPFLYPTVTLGKKRYGELKRYARDVGISIAEAFVKLEYEEFVEMEEKSAYMETMERMGWDIKEVNVRLLKIHRTVPHIRKVKRPPKVAELQERIKACEEELERLRAAPPVVAPPPPLAEEIGRMKEVFASVRTIEDIRLLKEVKSDIIAAIERWEEITNEDKTELCRIIVNIPYEVYRKAYRRYPYFVELFDICVGWIKRKRR